jgi:hypothetical protein
MSGNTKVKALNGVCTFSSINLIARPDYFTSLKFQSSAFIELENISRLVEIPVQFRGCKQGEVN